MDVNKKTGTNIFHGNVVVKGNMSVDGEITFNGMTLSQKINDREPERPQIPVELYLRNESNTCIWRFKAEDDLLLVEKLDGEEWTLKQSIM
jgi:hypothetical protein